MNWLLCCLTQTISERIYAFNTLKYKINLKRKRHEGTHYLFCWQVSGSTFGRLVSKWNNYFNYCIALNYSLWRKWWQVCRAVTLTLPLGSLSVLMKKPLHTTQTERDREWGSFVHWFLFIYLFICIDCESVICLKTKNKKKGTTIQGQEELQRL